MYNKKLKKQWAEEQRFLLATIKRVDKRICKMNEVACHETPNFEKLIAFANAHPVFFREVYHEYLRWPDIRFGDTLLTFCSAIKSEYYKLDKSVEWLTKKA